MIDEAVQNLAEKIAKKLREIKSAEMEKSRVQEELKRLQEEMLYLNDKLNRIDSTIASAKYEIANKLSDDSLLKLIKVGE